MIRETASAPVRRLFDIGVHAVTMDEALAICGQAVRTGRHLNIGVVNAAKIVAMHRNRQLFDAVAGSDLVLADGISVVWAGKILRQPLPTRVTGIDLFERLLREADEHGWSVYFLGATQAVLDEVVRRVSQRYPRLRIAGSRNGYFRDDEAPAVAEGIRCSRADLLFVAMTSPKKELFLGRFGRSLGVSVCHGVGGSFDVLAGKVSRAPRIWQRLGLEWLYRVVQEPRRMWRRYLVTNVQFGAMLFREALRGQRNAQSAPLRTSHLVAAPGGNHEQRSLRLMELRESSGGWQVCLLPGLREGLERIRRGPLGLEDRSRPTDAGRGCRKEETDGVRVTTRELREENGSRSTGVEERHECLGEAVSVAGQHAARQRTG